MKRLVLEILQRDDFEKKMAEMSRVSARQVISPLFMFLCSLDAKIKWNAVISMGVVVSALAEEDLESARVVMRRFMWNLNDESGGIGWGCPEAMGEIMARNDNLAQEFWCIQISYIRPDGNFLEHKILQRGALWGVGRLAHARPQLLKTSVDYLHPYMQSDDPYLRGLAAWAAGALRNKKTEVILNQLKDDSAKLDVYLDGHIIGLSVGEISKKALQMVKNE